MGNKNKTRIYLNLLQIRLPVTGMVSILHRVSGVLLTLCLPLSLYYLQLSLTDEPGFRAAGALLATWPMRLLILVLVWAFAHHLFAGMRHLLQDLDLGVSRQGGRRGAWAILVLGLVPVLWIAGRML
jgi:succinate dehydrogenase / fumarate reductase cytochrome b subunit